MQVLLLDLFPRGPFWDVWEKAFTAGPGKPKVLTAWEASAKYGAANVCFRELIPAIVGPAMPFTLHTTLTKCEGAPLLRAYADWVVRGLGLQAATHFARPTPPRTLVVTFMARRSSVPWPERAFCDERYFRCALFAHLQGERALKRVVKNEAELLARLRTLPDHDFSPPRSVVFADRDFNLLSFAEQLRTMVATDVLVGPHGAGLTHNIFMPDRARLVEIQIDGSTSLKHFNNLCTWRRGRDHYKAIEQSPNPVAVENVFAAVVTALEKIDVESY